jgi:hypothetical protein
MQPFEDLNEEMMLDIIEEQRDISIKVSDELTNFSYEIFDVDSSEEKEVPPTQMIFSREGIAEIILHTTPDVRGRFTRFVVFVYAFGGKIFYKKINDHYFEAKLKWPRS